MVHASPHRRFNALRSSDWQAELSLSQGSISRRHTRPPGQHQCPALGVNGIPLQVRLSFDSPSVLVEAADGTPLGRAGALEDAISRNAIPDVLVKAVLSIEDRRFFRHRGVDLRGVARATYANWSAGGIVEGGSTITQQLAKLQFVGNDRNFSRKFREALLAIWLEMRLTKDEILTRYMNTVYLGAGLHGISAAARHYFDKELKAISLPEAAMPAGLIQAPTRYNPIANSEAARHRAASVLDAILGDQVIDAQTADQAKSRADPDTCTYQPYGGGLRAQCHLAQPD
jgi:penicillin-binding protein 1A